MYVNSASHMHTSPPLKKRLSSTLSILCDSIVSWTSFVTYAEIFIVVSSRLVVFTVFKTGSALLGPYQQAKKLVPQR